MSFRLRLFIVVMASLLGSLAVVGFAINNSIQTRDTADKLATVDVARLQIRADLRAALHRIRYAEDHFGTGAMTAFDVEIRRQLDAFDLLLDRAKRYLPASGHGNYDEQRKLAIEVRELTEEIVDLRNLQQRQVDHLTGPLKEESARLQIRLEELLQPTGPGQLRRPGATDHLRVQSTALFGVFDYLRHADQRSLDVWRETLKLQQNQLRSVFLRLRGASEDPKDRATIARLHKETEAFVGSLVDLLARRATFESRITQVSREFNEKLDTLWDAADAMTTDLPRDLEDRQKTLAVLGSMLWWEVGGTFILASVLVVTMVIFLVARIERDVNKLKAVASAMEGGDLKIETVFERSVEELAELGRAFNKLATSLASVREKQTYRDNIVTGLNRSVRLADILRISLGELARATHSKTGCIYLKVMGRDEMLLYETYALPRGAAAPDMIRVGEGLVGQVARDRRTLVLDDVPAEALKIVSATMEADVGAVIVVPILFKDELMGVVELAGLGSYDTETVRFVEEVLFQIGVAINNAQAVETIRTTAKALERKTDELERANAELERANHLKSEFLANVSHELRTPLNAIIGFTDLVLETDTRIAAGARDNLTRVVHNADHLLALINDILDLSKIEAGRMEVVWSEVALPALVAETVANFKPMADSKGIELECEIEDVPASVVLDQDKATRIAQNLVANAMKFTERGQVSVCLWREADKLLLRVQDTGIGIPQDQLPVIFEKFRQVDGAMARRFGGTGLGLAITKELCHRMGGSIRVSSREGAGSTFTVTFPLISVDAAKEVAQIA